MKCTNFKHVFAFLTKLWFNMPNYLSYKLSRSENWKCNTLQMHLQKFVQLQILQNFGNQQIQIHELLKFINFKECQSNQNFHWFSFFLSNYSASNHLHFGEFSSDTLTHFQKINTNFQKTQTKKKLTDL